VDLTDYLAVLRRRKWIIVVVAVAVTALALLTTVRQVPLFRSATVVLINPISPNAVGALERNAARPDQLINSSTESLLATSAEVHERATRILRAKGDDPSILAGVIAVPTADVQVLSLEHVGTSPEAARDGAQAYAEAFLQYRGERALTASTDRVAALTRQVEELEELLIQADKEVAAADTASAEYQSAQSRRTVLTNQIVQLQSTIAGLSTLAMAPGEVLSEAFLPLGPFSPQRGRTAAAGLLVGSILGLVAAFLRDRFDDRLRSEDEVMRAAGVPVVANMARGRGLLHRSTAGLVTVAAPEGQTAESYRRLRSWLTSLPKDRAPRSLLITSAKPSEGKTTVACNLAVSLAESGHTVLLLSTDLRNPTAHGMFGMENPAGLSEVLAGRMPVESVIRFVPGVDGLSFVPSGKTPRRPADLLASPAMRELVERGLAEYDFVVLDAPPVLSVADCLAVSTYVDGILLAVKAGATSAAMLDHARGQLSAVGGRLLGAVMWNTTAATDDPYGYAPVQQRGLRWNWPQGRRANG
jgi:capsular exopolysaccharide synthesis family protein